LWLHTVWQPQIRRIWGWLHRSWSFAILKPPAGSGGALRLNPVRNLSISNGVRLPPRIEPRQKLAPCDNQVRCRSQPDGRWRRRLLEMRARATAGRTGAISGAFRGVGMGAPGAPGRETRARHRKSALKVEFRRLLCWQSCPRIGTLSCAVVCT
jgi:hypothetical protein